MRDGDTNNDKNESGGARCRESDKKDGKSQNKLQRRTV